MKKQNIFDFVGREFIPASAGKFSVAEAFSEENQKKNKIKLFLDSNFIKNFFDIVEEAEPRKILSCLDLKEKSDDRLNLAILGGERRGAISFRIILEKLLAQANAEDGPLLTNSCKNYFYVHDINGKLCVLQISWYGNGWFIKTVEPRSNYRNYGDQRFFSHRYHYLRAKAA